MLGKQFENTYFEDRYYVPTKVDDQPTRSNLVSVTGTFNEGSPDVPLQGMLYSPYTATGSGRDPLIDREKRLAAIDTAFKLGPEHRDNYKKTFERMTKSPMGNVDQNLEVLRDTAFNTHVPTDEFGRGLGSGRTALVVPRKGRAWAYLGGATEDALKLHMDTISKREIIPAHTKWVSQASKDPLPNKNFWNWYDKNRYLTDTAYEVLPEQLLDYHWTHQDTGEKFSKKHPLYKEVFKDPQWPELSVLRDSGFAPNLYPGKPSEGKGFSAGKEDELYFGWGYSKAITRAVHARFKPAESKQVDVPESSKIVTQKEIDPRTLVHEMGHAQDSSWGRKSGASEGSDPRHEGVADAYELKYSNALASRALDPKMFASTGSSGYGISYFKTKPQQALYAAVRAAILTTPDINTSSIPDYEHVPGLAEHEEMYPVKESTPNTRQRVRGGVRSVSSYEADSEAWRNTVLRQRARTNSSMLLGHMVEHYPHIMPYLQQVGLDKHAVGAHNEYTAVRHRLETMGESVTSMYRSQQPPVPEVPAEYDPNNASGMSESQFDWKQRTSKKIEGQESLF